MWVVKMFILVTGVMIFKIVKTLDKFNNVKSILTS